MSLLHPIDIACNDPDNGLFAGRAVMAQWRDMEFECDNWLRGYTFTETSKGFRLHRQEFHVVKSQECVGNWCWNRYWLHPLETKRFIRMLKASGRWSCTSGWTYFCAWFDASASS